jgi:hypothetical protein
MTTTTVYINFTQGAINPPAPWSYNNFNTAAVATLSSDLKDDVNASTNYTLDITAAFTGNLGSSSSATSGAGNWTDDEPFDFYVYVAAASTGSLNIGNLPAGADYTVELAGHRSASGSGRNTQFTVEGSSSDYVESGSSVPTAPVEFTGTVPGDGIISIDVDDAVSGGGSFAYLNGIRLIITEAGTTIDTITDPQVDQVENEVTTTGLTGTPAITVAGKSMTVGGSFASEPLTYTFDVAGMTDEGTNPDIGVTQTVTVTGDEGSPTSDITTAVKSDWAVTTLAGTLNTGDGGLIKAMNDALTREGLPTKTIVVGDRMYYDTQGGEVSIAADSTYTGDGSSFDVLLGQGGSATTVTTWTPFTVNFGTDIPVASRRNMSTIAAYLKTQGYTGTTNGIIYKWLSDETGLSSKTVHGLWKAYLDTKVTSGRTFQDKFHEWQNQ